MSRLKYFFVRLLFVFAVVLFLFSVCRFVSFGFLSADRYFSPGFLVCEEPSHDFGEVTKEDVSEHVFVLKNNGKKPVSVTHVIPGCGSCVEIVEFPQSPILPLQSATVRAKLLTENLTGPVKKAILIKCQSKYRKDVIVVHLSAVVMEKLPSL